MELIAALRGSGHVHRQNTLLGPTKYDLSVYQFFITGKLSDGSYRIPGRKRIEGTVRGHFPIGPTLTLVTAEGHTLAFSVYDKQGTIIPEGPLLTHDGKEAV